LKKKIASLKLTTNAPENQWLEDDSLRFVGSFSLFQGRFGESQEVSVATWRMGSQDLVQWLGSPDHPHENKPGIAI